MFLMNEFEDPSVPLCNSERPNHLLQLRVLLQRFWLWGQVTNLYLAEISLFINIDLWHILIVAFVDIIHLPLSINVLLSHGFG